MKKIDKEDVVLHELYKTSPRHRSVNKNIYEKIGELEIGEALIVSDGEWRGTTKPGAAVNNLSAPSFRIDRQLYNYLFSKMGRDFIGKKFTTRFTENNEYYIIRIEDNPFRKSAISALESYDIFCKEYENK